MSTRVIKLKTLTSSVPVSIVTDVHTFGEFKELQEVKNLRIDWESAKLIDRQTKHSFEIDSAILPEIDCIVFQTPTKSKAGLTDWKKASYKECKAKMRELKDAKVEIPFNYTTASSETMQNFLSSYYSEGQTASKSEDCKKEDTCDKNTVSFEAEVDLLVNEVSEKLSRLRYLAQNRPVKEVATGPKSEDVVELVTIQDLDREFAEIQRQLK